MQITDLLAFGVKNKAPNLYLSSEMSPIVRIHGDIRRISLSKMTAGEVGNMVTSAMNDRQRKIFQQGLEVGFSFELPNVTRFRVNALTSNHGPAAVFRTVPSTVLTLEDLHAPRISQGIADNLRELVLVAGPTGSGKSTTLAVMINYIDEAQPAHILIIEDPIEFVHPNKKTLIDQRELHQYTHSFANALRSALRKDPDVILVGEIHDPETVNLALTAAETGHLIFGTLHITDAAKTVDRIVDIFPADEEEMVCSMLSKSLHAVISQTLLRTRDGNSRVATHGILISTLAVRNLVRGNKTAQINSTLQTGQAHGMQALDQALQALVRQGTISPEVTRSKAQNSESLSIA